MKWRAEQDAVNSWEIIDEDGRLVAQVIDVDWVDGDDTTRLEDNVRKILALPDLLSACEAALPFIEGESMGLPSDSDLSIIANKLESAIAKAKPE